MSIKELAQRAKDASRVMAALPAGDIDSALAAMSAALLDSMVAEREDEMLRQIERWHHPSSMAVWQSKVASLRDIVEKRPEYALRNLAQHFGLSNDALQALIIQYSEGNSAEELP